MRDAHDVIIVGGGPAGLSAALMLGRCRRRVLLFDDERPRNRSSHASHGFFTRDGAAQHELRRIGSEQLSPYGVEIRRETVEDAEPLERGFRVRARGRWHRSRTLLLATGLEDVLPPVEGVEALYGTSVFHCPYCDAWEHRDRPMAACGPGAAGAELALALLDWTNDVLLVTNGSGRIPLRLRDRLARAGVAVRAEPLVRLEGRRGRLTRIVFASGLPADRDVLFFHQGTRQRSDLAARLGCSFTRHGTVRTGRGEETGIPGLYVAGDASRDVQWIAIASAEGARAAFSINRALRSRD